MSIESVRAYFAAHAPDLEIVETPGSSATVMLAAEAFGVEPGQIAKSIAVRVRDNPILIVAAGTARIDNKKFKDRFGAKVRMLDAKHVVDVTGHPVGGVCPFGLPHPLPVYCDQTLRAYDDVLPAAGSTNSAVRIETMRLAELIGAEWIDVCQ